MAQAKAVSLDFSNVKESSGINPKHIEDGEYLAKVVSVDQVEAKDGTAMWLFVITPDAHRSAAYPYYCKLQENQLWKVRNLFISAGLGGLVAGKKKVTIDPNKVVGKNIGIVLESDEYEGKMKSVIEAVMPASDLEDAGVDEDPEIEVDDDEDEVEEAPVRRRKAAPVVEEEDDEEEEEEVAPAPKKKRKAAPVVEEEDDEEEEEEAPAPVSKRTAKRRAAKAAAPVEEEDDDLDLDDI